MMEKCDILIIGAGIAGLSAACELAGFARVIVLERESQPGYHTTGRSAALYTQNYGNREIRALTRASHDFLTTPPPGFADHPILSPRGALFIAREDQIATLKKAAQDGSTFTSPVRLIGIEEALEINSSLNPDYLSAALYEPGARDIDVHALHNGYRKAMQQQGGQLITNSEALVITHANGDWNVKTSRGGFSAPILINAAGAWCDIIAEMAGVRPVGLMPKRRTVLTFSPPPGIDISSWPLTIDIDEEFYFKPDAGQLIVSPADETLSPPCDAQPEEIDIAIAIDRLQKTTSLEVRRINHKWAGLRSFVCDKTPVIGMDDESDGFFWLAAQGGYGIQTSPAIARLVASLIKVADLPDDVKAQGLTPTDLSPARLR